jgi:murein tripeptide amidase MpaA
VSAFQQRLNLYKIPFEVIIDSLQDLIDEEADSQLGTDNSDFFDDYRSYEDFIQFLNNLQSQYPDLVTGVTIGKTVQGRDIVGIKVTSNKGPANKPKIFYNGGQHAREWIGPMTVAYVANQLVTQYSNATLPYGKLVDNFEFTIVPLINVDGYIYTQTDRMWRKNRRQNGGACVGVDTNRNWDYQWMTGGSSNNPCSDTYAGPFAFSEPEVTAISNYLLSTQNRTKGYIDFHSYSQLVLNPWGYSTDDCPDNAIQQQMANGAAAEVKKVHGKTYEVGSTGQILYIASGSSPDWVYGAAHITYAYTIELRDTGRYGFLLPADQIVPQGEEIMPFVTYMANWILSH